MHKTLAFKLQKYIPYLYKIWSKFFLNPGKVGQVYSCMSRRWDRWLCWQTRRYGLWKSFYFLHRYFYSKHDDSCVICTTFQVDPFHTLFGIAGLSLLDYSDDIKQVNPVFCMPEYVIQKLKHKPEILWQNYQINYAWSWFEKLVNVVS